MLAVGAVGPGGALAAFSDRRTPVAVTAPGVDVTSAYPGTFPYAYQPDQNGTSFAAAFVSGVAALVRSAHPALDAAQVVARIEVTADGTAGPGTGHGLVDPVRAVTAVLAAESADPAADTGSARDSAQGGGLGGGHPAHADRAVAAGSQARTIAVAVIAGSFFLIVAVAVLAARRGRRRGPWPRRSGRHAR